MQMVDLSQFKSRSFWIKSGGHAVSHMFLRSNSQISAFPRPGSSPCRLRSQHSHKLHAVARQPSRFWLRAEDGHDHPKSGSETPHSSTTQEKIEAMSGFWQNFTLSSYTPFGWEPGRKFESKWAMIGKYNAHWLEAGACCGHVLHSLPVEAAAGPNAETQSQFKHHAAGSGPPFILLSSQVVQSRSYRTTLNVLSRCSTGGYARGTVQAALQVFTEQVQHCRASGSACMLMAPCQQSLMSALAHLALASNLQL